jgi:GDP-L-fucose synthase
VKVLVTGGTGFLGRHLVPTLLARGWEVEVINSRNCDLRDRSNLLQFKDRKFDRIYHLAAWTKAGDFCLHHKGEQWIINQLINTNVLWFWREYQPSALMIAMGTSCAYPPELELREENYMVGEPDRDLYTYAMTKRMLYTGLLALKHQFGMRFRYFIPSTLYGPRFDEEDSHFIFDLIKKIVRGRRNGDPVVLWGTGDQVRELVYVDDAVRLMEMAVERPDAEILNLASGTGFTIRRYAEMICRITGYEAKEIIYDTTRFSGVPKKVLSASKIGRLFDFAFTPIETGLRKTVEYYLSQASGNPNP